MVLGCLGVLLFVALAATGWLVVRGLQARTQLNAARADVELVRAALLKHDQATATAALTRASLEAGQAQAITSDRVWQLAAHVPYAGRTPVLVTGLSTAAVNLTRTVLEPLVEVSAELDPAKLRHGSQLDLASLNSAAPQVRAALARLERVQGEVAALPHDGVPSAVTGPVQSLESELSSTRASLQAVADAVELMPTMLGGQGSRRYLVVFQNNAEARATGGLVGAFGELEAVDGQLKLLRLGSDSELKSASALPVDLGPAYRALFGDDPALWQNTNLSANFPSAARLQLELWRRQFGEKLDGVIATDPVTLGYLLAVTGPTKTVTGEPVTGADVAELTLSTLYSRYPEPSQDPERRAELLEVAGAALQQLLSGHGGTQPLLDAFGRAAGERRLLVYSTRTAEEDVLAGTAIGGVVDDAPGPYAGLAVDNAAGNKLDYYLDRSLDYRVTGCGPQRASVVTVTLHNGAPGAGLPAYVTYRQDRGAIGTAAGAGDGSNKLDVLVYTARGSTLVGATLDGRPITLSPGTDGSGVGRPVFRAQVELAAGQRRVLVLQLSEPGDGPAATASPVAWTAPLVRPAHTTVEASSCR